MNTRFYHCLTCGKVVGLIHNPGVPTICCGQSMAILEPNIVDAAQEKHLPIYEISGEEIIIKVGEVPHPMDEDHYIPWVAIMNETMTIRVALKPSEAPEVKIPYTKGTIIYAYCNKHGLWQTKI